MRLIRDRPVGRLAFDLQLAHKAALHLPPPYIRLANQHPTRPA
jgi:hypothetical protein